jgi:Zn-finger nucleic acid-binding protein
MNCQNCGAAMEFHESRRYFRCAHCATVHFPEPAAQGDLRVLGVEQDAPPCPACRTPLAAATLNQGAAHYCQQCRGLLLDRQTFVEVVQTKRAWATSEPRTPGPLNRRDLERVVDCPRCRKRMSTHPYYGPGRIVIDTCDTCNLVWLDHGELERVVDAPGRDRGSNLRGGEGAWRDDGPTVRSEPTGPYRGGRIDLLKLLSGDVD